MAAPVGTENAAVEQRSIMLALEAEPWRFEFYQAVRLLQKFYATHAAVGHFGAPETEAVRFGANASMGFPASAIQALTKMAGTPPQLTVNFFGLFGPSGCLPLWYTDLVRERARVGDRALRDFLNIFNHRAISLLYRAWDKYRFVAAAERKDTDRFTGHLLDVVGLGTEGLRGRQTAPDSAFIFYGGLFAIETRSATALEQILIDYFALPVKIEQFVGVWRRVSNADRCCLGERNTSSECIGKGAVVGDEVFDRSSRIRIRLGPMSYREYNSFLPGGNARDVLRSIVRFFVNDTLDVEVQLVLRRNGVPGCELDIEKAGEAPRLGWTTWIKSAPFEREPDEAILELS